MGAIERIVGTNLPADMPITEWVEVGRALFTQRRDIDWLIGDWAGYGLAQYRGDEQVEMFVQQLGLDPKRAREQARIAQAFPPAQRSTKVEFAVYGEIASVAAEDRLGFIRRAEQEHWTPKAAHHAVVEWKHAQGQLIVDEDDTTREAVEIIRAWNRASPEAREYAFDLMEAVGRGKAIDESKAYD